MVTVVPSSEPDGKTNQSQDAFRWWKFLSIEVLLVILATLVIFMAVSWASSLVFVRTQFWILASLPGVVGLLYYFVHTLPRFMSRVDALKYRYSQLPDKKGARRETRETWPSFASYLWASLILTAVLGIPAVLRNLGGLPDPLSKTGGFGIRADGLDGLVYAAIGAYVALTLRMIARINNNALSSRFLLTSALRISMAMLIGFAAGEFALFDVVQKGGARAALYFLIGMFLNWAIQSLKRRARKMFDVAEEGCEILALCLVDGLDEQTIDYLEEMGIWDIQHLATADPAELTERTLYPLNRVLDWIDQAILISYFRGKIASAREVGIRGAIEFAVLYSTSTDEDDPLKVPAKNTLDALAQKVNLTSDALLLLGDSCYHDASVQHVWELWQEREMKVTSSSSRI
jgi:hypothetical protein